MEKNYLDIDGIPAVIYGKKSDKVYLYVHGKCGCKEEAERLANFACNKGWQVLGIDLPSHGSRKQENTELAPWTAVPEIKTSFKYLKSNWQHVALFANSIGAWFSMLALCSERIEKSLFVSPVVDMEKIIENMMTQCSITLETLKIKKKVDTPDGETLSIQYFDYAATHKIEKWNSSTDILYADKDFLTDSKTLFSFSNRFSCDVSVMENGEHWFHTPSQLNVLDNWISEKC